ncbi:MAG: cytochrome c, partial [Candidatus Tectomicrobia bacterium]|nr:cytochrome c [Candidatus Tectomicrobia bacterium]
MNTMRRRSERETRSGVGWRRLAPSPAALLSIAAAAALLGLPDAAVSQQTSAAGASQVTFAADVAPILYENCVSCHQENGMGPMSLMTYEEARPWAPLIKERVQSRFMPPWHIDRTVGIQTFKDDISLSDAEIETIARWVDAGAPLGDPNRVPPPPEFPDRTQWQLQGVYGRPPDLVIRSDPYTVPASGLDKWWYPIVPIQGIEEPRAVMATESRPSQGSYGVTHHANSNVSKYAVGKPYDTMPANVGLLIEPGHEVEFNIHYFPNGEVVEDAQLEVGMWFYPKDNEPKILVPWNRASATW